MKYIYKFVLLSLISTVALSQEQNVIDQMKVSNIPVGTAFSFDGKSLANFLSKCPVEESESLINGKKTIVKARREVWIGVQSNELACGSLSVNLFGRSFSILAKEVPSITPLVCYVESTEINQDDILTINFKGYPCSSIAITGARGALDFRNMEDMTVGSLLYNFGPYLKIKIEKINTSINVNQSTEQLKELPSTNNSSPSESISVDSQ
jgi:hypothetical protein